MIHRKAIRIPLLAVAVSMAPYAAAHAALRSPEDVRTALRLMMQVTNDFGRQIARKTYGRLPHENMEFEEASGALRTAVAAEPPAFRAKVERKVKQAVAQAQKVADESGGANETRLRAGHALLLKDVNAVFADFPEALRPDPNVQPGGRPPAP